MDEQEIVQGSVEKLEKMACAVYEALKSGYSEKIYKEALMVEFRQNHIPYERERSVTIMYKGVAIGTGFADIVATPIANVPIPIECKTVAKNLTEDHREQLRTYMNGMGSSCRHGILIQFKQPGNHEFEKDETPLFYWARKNDKGIITFYRRKESKWVVEDNKKANGKKAKSSEEPK
jgi:GxxExxY protein